MSTLAQAVAEKKVILFVGAGVSMNLKLPSWQELVAYMAGELNYDPEIFQTFGDHLELAEYYQLQMSSIGRLRSWIDREWHAGIDIGSSAVHRLIAELDFPIIYTTNYDRWLEKALEAHGKPCTTIRNVGDITKIHDGVTQVVKFHGDPEDDDSIVLTESSYFRRMDFESPLDIKLRSDILGKSALFIGYSLNDLNIRYLLYKLHMLWSGTRFNDVRPDSYIFITKPNPVKEAIWRKRGVETIASKHDDPGKGLTDFLEELLAESTRGAFG